MIEQKTSDRHQISTYPLRLPPELKQWLQQKALDNRRSFNAEVVVTLEQVQKQEPIHVT